MDPGDYRRAVRRWLLACLLATPILVLAAIQIVNGIMTPNDSRDDYWTVMGSVVGGAVGLVVVALVAGFFLIGAHFRTIAAMEKRGSTAGPAVPPPTLNPYAGGRGR